MTRIYALFTLCCCLATSLFAQLPNPALVGYWHNWNTANAPYIQLEQVDNRYNVIAVAFAVPRTGTDYDMTFTPSGGVTVANFKTKIQTLQGQGKKVLLSIGGGGTALSLSSTTERDVFASSMLTLLTSYGFDGMDIDIEGTGLSLTGGTIAAPVDASVINLIAATKTIMQSYYVAKGKQLLLTMAPETAFVQGGMSSYSGVWGAYLPVIQGLRDSLALVHVQLYNSGSMYGINRGIYTQGTADFIVALTEAVIRGFTTSGSGGTFVGLPASKVAIGLPACTSAAGGGFTTETVVASAVNYLRGVGPKPGTYTLVQSGGYPTLRGMMTWSMNWDAVATCNTASYKYAQNFQTLFGSTVPIELLSFSAKKEDKNNLLKWQTASETNVAYFDIERSYDGLLFEKIASTKANNTPSVYTHSDALFNRNNAKIIYYRLKTNDLDGRFSFSKIISLTTENTEGSKIKVFPNPANAVLFIDSAEGKMVEIINILGQTVAAFSLTNNHAELAINHLQTGVYFVKTRGEMVRFVKQ
jgi:chitinase